MVNDRKITGTRARSLEKSKNNKRKKAKKPSFGVMFWHLCFANRYGLLALRYAIKTLETRNLNDVQNQTFISQIVAKEWKLAIAALA